MGKKKSLLILAAGMGSRYGGLKQLDGVGPNGETIMEYSIYDAIRAGFDQVIFVIRKSFEEAFQDQILSKFEDQIDIKIVYQALDSMLGTFMLPATRQKPWGTGHAVLCARDAIDGPFVLINADDFYGKDAYVRAVQLMDEKISKEHLAMVGYRLVNTLSDHGTVSRGICDTQAQHLIDVREHHKIAEVDGAIQGEWDGAKVNLAPQAIASMNYWILDHGLFDLLEADFHQFLAARGHEEKSEYYIPSFINDLLKKEISDVHVEISEDAWYGVTYLEDKDGVISSIQELVNKKVYPSNLWGKQA